VLIFLQGLPFIISQYKTTSSVLDKKIKICHILTEEKLEDIGARFERSTKKITDKTGPAS
jgi:hypothetical protein